MLKGWNEAHPNAGMKSMRFTDKSRQILLALWRFIFLTVGNFKDEKDPAKVSEKKTSGTSSTTTSTVTDGGATTSDSGTKSSTNNSTNSSTNSSNKRRRSQAMTKTPTAAPGGEFRSASELMSEVHEVCNAFRQHQRQAANALEHNPAALLAFWHQLDGVCLWVMEGQAVGL